MDISLGLGSGFYVGPFLRLGLWLILWSRAYLWARPKSICDGLRKGWGGSQGGGRVGQGSARSPSSGAFESSGTFEALRDSANQSLHMPYLLSCAYLLL